METLKKIQSICNGIPYTRHIPEEAEKLAKENNVIVIIGGSDDLMYAYGAESYLTYYREHGEGWDGSDLEKHASDDRLKKEAKQLGLKIFWCGSIANTGETIKGYSVDKNGAFSYQVSKKIEYLEFEVMEYDATTDVYCTGIIIKLPDDFISAKDE